ncbi:dephospho-CoA kinase [Gemella haemolysans]|uniref:Dephospho-CoA kinase n=1 Tax=Gemella haemolysans TaxID=1379 RepID=A0A133ZUY3_9BACL|nr:dephospho-CoA kinase [Gemella haemolysans]KXB59246.1 dephospho-CoA kinase [Gemella haemolysans]MDU3832243.1 dephospho-CoA kinase [Gemella haemolysans]TKW62928.1 MAG: dephospho-CoA kinase [Gemella sp.]
MNIGITGSIACGKSTVSDYLKEKGYTIIDADKLGHVALTSEDVKRRLSETFGANILVNNEISREVLGKLVFGNDNNLKKLNNIIHPKIKELILKLQEEHENEDLVFLDIALLYEANFVDLVEKVAVVYVDEDVQLERLMTRNFLSKEEALKRIESQMSPQEKASLGDFVINNSYRKEDTFQQIDEILEKLKRGDKQND